LPNLERRFRETENLSRREELSKYQTTTPCKSCQGHRLKSEALAIKIQNRNIAEITALSIAEAVEWFNALDDHLGSKQREIAHRILKEIRERLGFLYNVAQGYLTLARSSGTL
ncbi:MAG: excinuclease ABC subunit A, partial [Alphaproteobacteria bacterium]|nr:excinuclease ABC subunit A [Alphaproteobacteria bacterium]